jgi:hypothetical protein
MERIQDVLLPIVAAGVAGDDAVQVQDVDAEKAITNNRRE